jgi:hypothetical protein
VTPVVVSMRSSDSAVPRHDASGYVPFDESPLAVVHCTSYDRLRRKWRDYPQWQIAHRPTGFSIGALEFADLTAAINFLHALDPSFPAWQSVQWQVDDAAMVACRYKFRVALEAAAAA